MDLEKIKVGNRIEMVRVQNALGAKVKPQRYSSQLLDIINTNTLKIAMPIEKYKVIPLEIGELHFLRFYADTGLFQCKGKIVNRYKHESLYICEVELRSELEKHQRRKYFRLECLIPVQLRELSMEEKEYIKKLNNCNFPNKEEQSKCEKILFELQNELQKECQDATAIDISGGGIRLVVKKEFQCQQEIILSIPIKLYVGTIFNKFEGKIISCVRNRNSTNLYEIRVEFLEMPENKRERIIKFIFDEQRKRMKKG